MLAALSCPDPVIFLEPKRVYRSIKADVPKDFYTLPLGHANVVRQGVDATLVAYGAMTSIAVEAATLAEGEGYDIEVIDLLSLLPYDVKAVLRSVEKTGRLVVVHEAPRTCGFAAELIATVQEKAFTLLQAPLRRLTGFDTPFPYSLEDHYLPGAERIVHELIRVIES